MALIKIDFLSGAGNILATLDNRDLKLNSQELPDLARKLNAAKKDVGTFEGLLSLNESSSSDFSVDFYNPDGTTGAMCGNGARVAVYSAREFGIANLNQKALFFKMAGALYQAQVLSDNHFAIHFAKPIKEDYNREIAVGSSVYSYSFLNIGGALHSVFKFTDLSSATILKINDFDLEAFAPQIRSHQDFGSEGTNVNVYAFNDNQIIYRTFERGVEAETGACGTGAIATALTAINNNEIASPVKLVPPSGSILEVSKKDNNEIVLSGGVEKLKTLDFEF